MQNYPLQVAQAVLNAGAFKISFDPLFTWTSGIKSPIYCDLRALTGDVEGRDAIVEAFVEMFPYVKSADAIAGTATAGISWAAWVADRVKKPMVYVRGAAKEHGTKKRIEGLLKPGSKVVLIEDLISTGGSSISSAEAIAEEGQSEVTAVLAINTHEIPKSVANFEEAGLDLATITNTSNIIAEARSQGIITEEQEAMLADFWEDPAGWAGRHGLA